MFDSSGEFIYKINPQVDHTVRIHYVDVATDVNNTYILVRLRESGTERCEVQVFTKTEMCNKFPVRAYSYRLTVSHDRVFVASLGTVEIGVFKLNGIPVGTVGKGTLSRVRDIAAGSDGQIYVLNDEPFKEKIAYVFTEDGHQQNNFRVDSKEDNYLRLASYLSGEYIVFSGVEGKTERLKVAMYHKDGEFNRSVTLGERLLRHVYYDIHGITATNDGSVAISFCDQEDQGKVIVRPMKPC